MEKSVFEARDIRTNFLPGADKEKYIGRERRRGNRRIQSERRSEVRFDLSNADRRQKPGGRRDDDAQINFI
jgi:hypothetical protein